MTQRVVFSLGAVFGRMPIDYSATIWSLSKYTHTTIYGPFVWDYPGGQLPEETFTHSYPS